MRNDPRPHRVPTRPATSPTGLTPARRPAVLAGAATLALAGMALAAPTAAADTAAESPESFEEAARAYLADKYDLSTAEADAVLGQQEEALETAAELEAELGSRVVGAIVDERTGELTVEVSDAAAAVDVRADGAEAVVERPTALERAQRSLSRSAGQLGAVGVSVSVDLAGDALVLSVPAGQLDAATATLVDRAGDLAVPVRVERTQGAVDTLALYGGEAILRDSGGRCSAGFNLRDSSGTFFLLSAGHCSGDTWSDDGVTIGLTSAESFPGDDYKLIEISSPGTVDPRGEVLYGSGLYDVSSAGSPPIGATVCRTGSTTGTRCGSIQAYNATVTYAEGSVFGLVRTTVCAEPGDSGGPLYASGGVAVGVTSGGSGNCTFGGTTYYQPVSEVTSLFGLQVI